MRKTFVISMIVAIVALLSSAGYVTARTATKYEQLRGDLDMLAQYHDALAHGGAATPELQEVLERVAAREEALVDRHYAGR